jgi:hypothetical protein
MPDGSVEAHDLRLEGEVWRHEVSEAQEAKQLRDENTKLKKLAVDLSLDKEMLKAVIAKNGWSSSTGGPMKLAAEQVCRERAPGLRADGDGDVKR